MKKLLAPLLSGLALAIVSPAVAVEHATYNSAGALTSLVHDGAELPIHGELVVSFEGGVHQTMQPHDQRSPITRADHALHWSGLGTFPNGGQAQFDAAWQETADAVSLETTAVSGAPLAPGQTPPGRFPLLVESVDYVIDLPRETFAGGRIEPSGTPLSATRVDRPELFAVTTASLAFVDASKNWRLALTLDQPRLVTLTDRWDATGRSYRLRIRLGAGAWAAGEALSARLTFALTGAAHAAAAHVTVDPAAPRYAFDGFGGDYCFNVSSPVVEYTMENLTQAWMRFELKGYDWDRTRATEPDAALERDFELMQRAQKKNLPWIISLWRVPERFYTDANQKPVGSFGRQIAPDRWPELLDLIGSYLVYLRKNYAAEPDYFSFNESDLGVDIGFTAATHRDMIKRVGAHLASLGLKTKMLLGDTANPRDSHLFVLPTLADPEAMRYVGAVSFHSWGGGTPAQYAAWGDVGAWTGLPLVVAEAGTDPGAYRNHTFDSYAYGLGEMRQYQELLRDSRPTAILYWQFTDDYSLVHLAAGKTIEPTGRFWLMKHFTNLTPLQSRVVASTSDQPDVLVSAFARGDDLAIHILNTGPAREATLTGLPAGKWRRITTTETAALKESADPLSSSASPLTLPARSLTTLVRTR